MKTQRFLKLHNKSSEVKNWNCLTFQTYRFRKNYQWWCATSVSFNLYFRLLPLSPQAKILHCPLCDSHDNMSN